MKAKKKKMLVVAIIMVVLMVLIVWIVWGNTALELNCLTISSEGLPEAFEGYRIAHISDVHNIEMGKDNEKLLDMLREASPNIIAITGDLIDSRNTDIEIALCFMQKAVKIAPCYYVTGNHETRVSKYDELKIGMETAGVVILADTKTEISLENEKITLIGVNDPSHQTDYLFGDSGTVIDNKLNELHTENDGFTVLLSHRPELFEVYADNGINLVLSGHAHGGQFRLPLVGGLVAPNQGLFPKYDAGLYTQGHTNMVVSKGIGNSIIPFRFNNNPEVILIELKVGKS